MKFFYHRFLKAKIADLLHNLFRVSGETCTGDHAVVDNTISNWRSQGSDKKVAPSRSDCDNQSCDDYLDETNVTLISHPSSTLGSSVTASVSDCQRVIDSKRIPYPDDYCTVHAALLEKDQQAKKTAQSIGATSVNRSSQKMKLKRNSCVDADSCSSDQDLCRICQIGEGL